MLFRSQRLATNLEYGEKPTDKQSSVDEPDVVELENLARDLRGWFASPAVQREAMQGGVHPEELRVMTIIDPSDKNPLRF